MGFSIKQNNTWQPFEKYHNVNGTWMNVFNQYHKVDGVWKPVYSYRYDVGTWGACSVPCGGGIQTRSVICKRNDNVTKPDRYCTKYGLTKPATTNPCNTHSCSKLVTTFSNYDDGHYLDYLSRISGQYVYVQQEGCGNGGSGYAQATFEVQSVEFPIRFRYHGQNCKGGSHFNALWVMVDEVGVPIYLFNGGACCKLGNGWIYLYFELFEDNHVEIKGCCGDYGRCGQIGAPSGFNPWSGCGGCC